MDLTEYPLLLATFVIIGSIFGFVGAWYIQVATQNIERKNMFAIASLGVLFQDIFISTLYIHELSEIIIFSLIIFCVAAAGFLSSEYYYKNKKAL